VICRGLNAALGSCGLLMCPRRRLNGLMGPPVPAFDLDRDETGRARRSLGTAPRAPSGRWCSLSRGTSPRVAELEDYIADRKDDPEARVFVGPRLGGTWRHGNWTARRGHGFKSRPRDERKPQVTDLRLLSRAHDPTRKCKRIANALFPSKSFCRRARRTGRSRPLLERAGVLVQDLGDDRVPVPGGSG